MKKLFINKSNAILLLITLLALGGYFFPKINSLIGARTSVSVVDDVEGNGYLDGDLEVTGSLTVDTDTLYVNATNDRVGISTSSPTQTLSVVGTPGTDLINFASSSGDSMLFLSEEGYLVVDTDTLYVDAVNHRLGVDTDSTYYDLQIGKQNSTGNEQVAIVTGGGGDSYLKFIEADSKEYGLAFKYDGGDNALYLNRESSGTTYGSEFNDATVMTFLRDSNNIGMGDLTPDATLEIVKNDAYDYLNLSSAAANDGDVLTVDTNGNVGIGVSAPDTKIELLGDIHLRDSGDTGFKIYPNTTLGNVTGNFISSLSDGSGHKPFVFRTSSNNRLYIGVNGYVGIATTSPETILDVDGGIRGDMVTADPCGTGYPEGTIFYNDTSNYYCYCDGTNDVKLHDPSTACF